MTIEGDEAHTIAGRFESSLRLLPADEFPRLARPADDAVTFGGQPESAELQIGRHWPPGRSAGRN